MEGFGRETDRQRQRQTETEKEREGERETETERDRQTGRVNKPIKHKLANCSFLYSVIICSRADSVRSSRM